jgi:hypothetical protein
MRMAAASGSLSPSRASFSVWPGVQRPGSCGGLFGQAAQVGASDQVDQGLLDGGDTHHAQSCLDGDGLDETRASNCEHYPAPGVEDDGPVRFGDDDDGGADGDEGTTDKRISVDERGCRWR